MSRAPITPATPANAAIPKLTITDASDLEYFAEGAANILYRYIGKDEKFKTHLIRLRKYLPNFPSVFQLYDHLQKVFVPLLPTFVLDTQLIELSPGVLKALNGRLLELEDERAYDKFEGIAKTGNKRKGKLDETERWGMIVEDMTPGSYREYNQVAASLLKERRNGSKDALIGFFAESLLQLDDRSMPRATMDAATLSKFGWRDILTVEFKPKYLVQSPDAPKDWKLCRTCALRNMRSRTLSGTSTASNASGTEDNTPFGGCPEYCPLDLASGEPFRVRKAMEAIVGRETGITVINEDEVQVSDPALGEDGVSQWLDILDESIVGLLTDYFSDPVCITRVLADLQSQFGGKIGVLAPPTPNLEISAEDFSRSLAGHPTTTKIGEDICTAMSLRDCTVFLRFWVKPKRTGDGIDVHIECKIGDLDMKTGEGGKGVYWREVERRLIRGDWYAGRGLTDGPGCRGQTTATDDSQFKDYVITHDGPPESSQLLRNGSDECFQLQSKLLRVPKAGRAPGTTTAA